MAHEEKRRYARHYFVLSDALQFQVTAPSGAPQAWPATLLCLGGGGLGFVVQRHLAAGLVQGSRIRVKAEQLPTEINLIHDLECEVVYVLDNDLSVFLSYGCQFARIAKAHRARLIDWVNARNQRVLN
jgi:hypothetical protein